MSFFHGVNEGTRVADIKSHPSRSFLPSAVSQGGLGQSFSGMAIDGSTSSKLTPEGGSLNSFS